MFDVEWTTTHYAQIDAEAIADHVRAWMKDHPEETDLDDVIEDYIGEEICGWDDGDYYAWTREAQDQVVAEVKRLLGGVQLRMEGV